MYLTTNFANGTGKQCSFGACDRLARFKIQAPNLKDGQDLCSACVAKCIETIYILKDTIQSMESTENV